jgi:hypothetical protein
MEDQKLHQNTLTFTFKKVTSEDRKIALQHEINLLNACIVLNKTILKLMKKQPIGAPQKYVVKLLSNQEIKQEVDREANE